MVEVAEGPTTFFVPEGALEGTPREDGTVFYNPEMRPNRDLTVLAVRSHVDEWGDVRYLDAMAGTGVRGVRVATEAGARVSINDRSGDAVRVIERNVEHAGVEAEVLRRDANALLSDRGFDLIDLDPFGSPAPFLDSSARSIHMHGKLFVTATDTAPLCGAHPSAGRRRYGARSLNGEHEKEVGARILLGFVARSLARYDKAAVPLLTLYHRHYFRLFVGCERGASRADEALGNVGYLLHCPSCRRNEFVSSASNRIKCRCGGERILAGPLWTGELHGPGFLEEIRRAGEDGGLAGDTAAGLLERVQEEVGGPPLYFDHSLTASRAKASPPPLDDFVEKLEGMGYEASRTHFDPEAVKTDAPPELQEELVREG